MLPNREIWGSTETPLLAPHQALGLNEFHCSTSPLSPVLGWDPGKGNNSEFGPKSVLFPNSWPGGPSQRSSPEKKKEKKKMLVLTPRRYSVCSFRHIPQGPKRNAGEGARVSGLHHDKLERDPTLGSQSFPAPKRPRPHPARVPKPTPEGPPASPLAAAPPGPQEGGGREPLPTENSHFFALRFRNTPGLMPSGELCNQGHRSRAKQTRLCVQRRPRGSAPGQGGAQARPQGRRVCSANAAGGDGERAPRGRGPGPSAGPRAGQVGSSGARPLPPAAAPASGL